MEISSVPQRITGEGSNFSGVPNTETTRGPLDQNVNGDKYLRDPYFLLHEPRSKDIFSCIEMLERIPRSDVPRTSTMLIDYKPTKLAENTVITLPIMFNNINLLPCDFFYVRFPSIPEFKKLTRFVTSSCSSKIFVVSHKLNGSTPILGTTVEIFHISEEEEYPKYTVFMVALQMCEILNVKPSKDTITSIKFAEIKIIPANKSCYPFQKLCLNTRNQNSRGNKAIGDRCLTTPWPSWVYKQLDSVNLVSKLVARVQKLHTNINLIFPDDPYLLSFDVLKLNIFTEEQKQYLQAMNSNSQRLQYEFQCMDHLTCFCCNAVVTTLENIFHLPPMGPRDYRNSYHELQIIGMIYSTKLSINVVLLAKPTTTFCLYPKYKWQEISCGVCSNRLGWQYFSDVQSVNTPKLFYGLKRSAITSTNIYMPKQNNRASCDERQCTGYWSEETED